MAGRSRVEEGVEGFFENGRHQAARRGLCRPQNARYMCTSVALAFRPQVGAVRRHRWKPSPWNVAWRPVPPPLASPRDRQVPLQPTGSNVGGHCKSELDVRHLVRSDTCSPALRLDQCMGIVAEFRPRADSSPALALVHESECATCPSSKLHRPLDSRLSGLGCRQGSQRRSCTADNPLSVVKKGWLLGTQWG
jgi:hypothetical protein